RHAVLEALAVRVALSSPRPPARLEAHHRERGLSAARQGPAHLRFVDERTEPLGGVVRRCPDRMAPLLALAQDRYGHEPIAVSLPDVGEHAVRRVVCPGAEVFEPIHGAGAPAHAGALPCPIA
ncbi:MAG TPA: hypothetical protein VFR35_19330, partial [Actinoplanes sp.]|nr:hypothetical protein [Actinoplanes sp.]